MFLLGGGPGLAERGGARLRADSPGPVICGTHCPPRGFEPDPALIGEIESALRAAQPDIVFVVLGFPNQERLIQRLRARFPSAWFVSASFSFASGELTHAPRWMQRTGLEWVHRLVQKPRRYLLDDIPFQRRHRVADRLAQLGGQVDEFRFSPEGLTIWTADG